MKNGTTTLRLATLLLAGAVSRCGSEALCDPSEVSAALADASSQEVVRLGACTIPGAFTVPAGAVLRGEGPAQTTIDGTVTLASSSAPTRVEGLQVASDGPCAIDVVGTQAAAIEAVRITARTGRGICADSVASLTVTNTAIEGMAAAITTPVYPPDETLVSTFGIFATQVGQVALDDVSVARFAGAAAVFDAVDLMWVGGTIQDNVNAGVYLEASTAALNGVDVVATTRGTPAFPPYGIIATGTTTLALVDTTIDGTEGVGVLQDGGAASLVGLEARNNDLAAVWTQRSTSTLVEDAVLTANALAGVIAVDATGVEVRDTTVRDTRTAFFLDEHQTLLELGDGIQLVDALTNAQLTNVTVEASARAGVAIRLAAGTSLPASLLGSVMITTTATTQLEVLVEDAGTFYERASNGMLTPLPPGLDYDFAGIVGPCNRPVAP